MQQQIKPSEFVTKAQFHSKGLKAHFNDWTQMVLARINGKSKQELAYKTPLKGISDVSDIGEVCWCFFPAANNTPLSSSREESHQSISQLIKLYSTQGIWPGPISPTDSSWDLPLVLRMGICRRVAMLGSPKMCIKAAGDGSFWNHFKHHISLLSCGVKDIIKHDGGDYNSQALHYPQHLVHKRERAWVNAIQHAADKGRAGKGTNHSSGHIWRNERSFHRQANVAREMDVPQGLSIERHPFSGHC